MYPTSTRRAAAAGASTLALATLSACGAVGDLLPGRDPFLDQSPRSIARSSFDDMQDVSSMRILGDIDTKRFGRMRVDISVGRSGCRGSFDAGSGGGFELRQNADGTWLRADEKFVRAHVDGQQGDQAWRMFRGKWFVADGENEDFADLCSLDDVLADFELEPEDTGESVSSDDVVEVGDAEAIPITGGRGRKRTTIWVSLDAPHHVLKMAPAQDAGLPDALYFEEFGTKVVVETPSKKEILDLPKGQAPA
ncbi:hypothetical protein L2K70_06555 [Nocardioides KLBMP 9356]|uniref:LppX_LprAFG lipoprotein n=1 Tax=Nocardioides potassii TaxID=2911371 RepID=A0ABS9HB47_9ACTN|nr:hypothetical protein [Nocardioides potassii]MCF6377258.1 hypothetical protein [Nocardioides potassii]